MDANRSDLNMMIRREIERTRCRSRLSRDSSAFKCPVTLRNARICIGMRDTVALSSVHYGALAMSFCSACNRTCALVVLASRRDGARGLLRYRPRDHRVVSTRGVTSINAVQR